MINPETIRTPVQSAIIVGITATSSAEIRLKQCRAEQTNLDGYQIPRLNEVRFIALKDMDA